MNGTEKKAFQAKQLRFKKPIARNRNIEPIRTELYEMISECEDIHWYDNDEESLVNALDGDEDEAFEFKIAFSDLEADLECFQKDLGNEYISEYFDTLFLAVGADYYGGYLGLDQYERDYFGLKPYEYSFAENKVAKKIMSLTKKQILEVVSQCLKIAYQYMGIRPATGIPAFLFRTLKMACLCGFQCFSFWFITEKNQKGNQKGNQTYVRLNCGKYKARGAIKGLPDRERPSRRKKERKRFQADLFLKAFQNPGSNRFESKIEDISGRCANRICNDIRDVGGTEAVDKRLEQFNAQAH